jgi:hypothetical protein
MRPARSAQDSTPDTGLAGVVGFRRLSRRGLTRDETARKARMAALRALLLVPSGLCFVKPSYCFSGIRGLCLTRGRTGVRWRCLGRGGGAP